MHAIICIFDFMSFIIKFIKFKPIIKFKKLELHSYDFRERARCPGGGRHMNEGANVWSYTSPDLSAALSVATTHSEATIVWPRMFANTTH